MTDPHPGRGMRDIELLQWTTSAGKRLRLGSGDVADGGGWGFAAGAERLWRPGISNGEKGAMGGGEACHRNTLVQNVGCVTKVPPTDLN